MTRDAAKEIVKGYLESYLQGKGINTRKPFNCLNPQHPDAHPSMSYDRRNNRCKCFSCGASYDIFNLIGIDYRLSDYNDIFNKAYEIYGIQIDGQTWTAPAKAPAPPKIQSPPPEKPLKDYTEDFKKWRAALEGSPAQEYLSNRGISLETAKKYYIGYNPSYYATRFKQTWNAVIIPTSKNTYVVRNMATNCDHDKRYDATKGDRHAFNKTALTGTEPVFITEGELDALSILEVGYQATGLGGLGKIKLVEYLISERDSGNAIAPLILAFDNDEPGNNTSKEISEMLNNAHIAFYKPFDVYGVQKDANECLTANRGDFEANLRGIVQDATNYFNELRENPPQEPETPAEDQDEIKPVGAFIDLFKQHREETKSNIRTGFLSLDKALGGGFSNELYILGADTGTGKSAIASVLAQNIALQGIDVLYYALEMGRDEFIARGASCISKDNENNPFDDALKPIKFSEILNDTYDEKTDKFYRRAYSQYAPFVEEYQKRYGDHLYIIEGGINGRTAKDIATAVKDFKQKHGNKQLAVFIDYLQLLGAERDDKLQKDQMNVMSTAVKILKSLASQEGATVFAISSVANDKKWQNINEASFKYSGDISYTGGVLLGWNWKGVTDEPNEERRKEVIAKSKENEYRTMFLEILKQRNGERNNEILLTYMPAYNYIED